MYTYLKELYGESIGFLLGWVQTIISYPAFGAALSIAFATYANIYILRKKQKPVEGACKVLLYPIVPVVGILGGVYILISTLKEIQKEAFANSCKSLFFGLVYKNK